MKTLILGLAETAEPLEASALREVAQNYQPTPEPEPREFELKFRHIILIAVAVYAIWTPFYLLAPRPTIELAPQGRRVEQLGNFAKTPDGRYTTQTYKFGPGYYFADGVRSWTYSDDPVPLIIYEGETPLPKENYEFQQLHPQNAWRFVTIRASDNSDPSKNGRRYYVVLQ